MEQLNLPFEEKRAVKKILYTGRSLLRLEKEAVQSVREIKDKNPLKPLVILAPSHLCACHLKTKISGGGIFYFNFEETAYKLAEENLYRKNLKKIPLLGEEYIGQKVLNENIPQDSPIFPFIKSPGLLKFFMALLKDFRQGGFESFPDIPHLIKEMNQKAGHDICGDRLPLIFKLINTYRENFRGKYFDVEDILTQAAGNAPLFEEIFKSENLIVYGFPAFDRAQQSLLKNISHHINVTAFLPLLEENPISDKTLDFYEKTGFQIVPLKDETPTGVERTALEILKENLFKKIPTKTPLPCGAGDIQIFSCPTPLEEAKETARQIFRLAKEGLLLDKIGIYIKNPLKYAPLFEEVFRSSGIPYYNPEGKTLDGTPGGKSLKLFLNLIKKNFPRGEVCEFMNAGNINFANIFADGETCAANPSLWETLTRKTRIRQGFDQWNNRLKNRKDYYERNLNRSDDESEKLEISGKILEIENFLDFIKELNKDLHLYPGRASWSEYTNLLAIHFLKYIEEDEISRELLEELESLKDLEPLNAATDFETYRAFCLKKLEKGKIKGDRFNSGNVTLITPQAALGLSFDAIFIPGLTWGEFPSPPRSNPLILDEEREIFNQVFDWEEKLILSEDLASMTPLHFFLSTGSAARNLILTYPRSDGNQQESAIPSPYIIETARILAGKEVFYGNLERQNFIKYIPSRYEAIIPPEKVLNSAEARENILRNLEKISDGPGIENFIEEFPLLKKSLVRQKAIYQDENFSEFQGVITPDENLKKLIEKIFNPASDSKFRDYFTCPYNFFLRRVMGIIPPENEKIYKEVSAKDRGSLYHEIFCKFYEELIRRDLLPLDSKNIEESAEIMEKIAGEAFTRFEEAGLGGDFSRWFEEKIEIFQSLRKFVEEETKVSENLPRLLEFSFGGDVTPPAQIDLGDNIKLSFHGRIDRVDFSRDGKICQIIDYKTGKYQKAYETLDGGRKLQLPLYLYSIKQVYSNEIEIEKSRACYYFATSKGEFKKSFTAGEKIADLEENLKIFIKGALKLSREGLFITYPGEKTPDNKEKNLGENCRYCDYRPICPADILNICQKKNPEKFNHLIKEFIQIKGLE